MIFFFASVQMYFLYFFFSSRRRHTRCLSDWSSDVCSSDLGTSPIMDFNVVVLPAPLRPSNVTTSPSCTWKSTPCRTWLSPYQALSPFTSSRSEERRVGKECRSRWAGSHQDKKKIAVRSMHV